MTDWRSHRTYRCRGGRHDLCFNLLAMRRNTPVWCACGCHFEFNQAIQRRQFEAAKLFARADLDGPATGSPAPAVAVVDTPRPLAPPSPPAAPTLEPPDWLDADQELAEDPL
jgi:hypothetical protein